jgi:hypothetical protein
MEGIPIDAYLHVDIVVLGSELNFVFPGRDVVLLHEVQAVQFVDGEEVN